MEKIKKLRKLIKKFNIDGYLVPKNDEYFLEYLKVDRDRLRFITNFTGSFGFSIILQKKNYLFVDGRYSQQAERESGKNFKIVTIPKKMPHQILKKKLRLGYDPKLFNISADIGNPVLAIESGKIVYAGNEIQAFGNLILIKHYLHLFLQTT